MSRAKKLDPHDRRCLEQILEALRNIATLDRDEGFADPGTGYARALGRANGMALGVIPYAESLLGVRS